MLQIRILNPSDDSAIILDRVDNIAYFKTINSADEGISFDISINDPKSDILDPYQEASYTNIWQVWDTDTNEMLNYGPIKSIDDGEGVYKVQGAGRSDLLNDHFKTLKTFYASIDRVIEEVRYENLASAPTTRVIISSMDNDNPDEEAVFQGRYDETFYGLSKRTKDFVIDDSEAYIPLGKIEPPRTYSTTTEYWTGMTSNDTLWIDLNDSHDIHRVKLMFPWWGGPQRINNRTYDFGLKWANPGTEYLDVRNRDWGPIEEIFNVNTAWTDSRVVTMPGRPFDFYIGQTQSGLGTGINVINALQGQEGPINARYIGVHINRVHAWYGSQFDTEASHDGYTYQCRPDYQPGDDPYFGNKDGLMTYRTKSGVLKPKHFRDQKITPASDCHASIVELGVYKEILKKDTVKPLALQRIDNNNKAITYYRVPNNDGPLNEVRNSEIDDLPYKRFEPGTFFNKFGVTWTGASNTYTRFFRDDCVDCYPTGFSFGIVDDENNFTYRSDSSSGTNVTVKGKNAMSHIIFRGASNVDVTWIDAWKGMTDPMSWGGSYSYTEKTNDYFYVHFRGESFKWYATIPSNKTGARVKIELRNKVNITHANRRAGAGHVTTNFWSDWTTLESDYQLPDDITNEVVYEIPYGSGILDPNTVYEIKVTLLDNGYCSLDSIEGYWSGSFIEYNEDSTRLNISNTTYMTQIYDKRFSAGSMYKWNKPKVSATFSFEGDRVIVKSAKGRHHGKLRFLLFYYSDGVVDYDAGVDEHVFIPEEFGGDPDDGSITVDLDTGAVGQEITQYVAFDTDPLFRENGGLPWGKYSLMIIYHPNDAVKYTTSKYEQGSNNFIKRCHNCDGNTGPSANIYEYVYLDGIIAHEQIGLSVQFQDTTHLDIIKSVAEAIQVEWDVTPNGIRIEPRLGQDTHFALREGENVLVRYGIVNDLSKIATRLFAKGSDIDGLPLTALIEDKKTRRRIGRTITRQADFTDIADYMQLIGLARTELKMRNRPEKRITVSYAGADLPVEHGDSFMLWTKKLGNVRVRINRKERVQSSGGGTVYNLECVQWPRIT
jgi:hypothetical protein